MGAIAFMKICNNPANTESVVRETVMVIFDWIPDVWFEEDEEFQEDIKRAKVEQLQDKRPVFCGQKASAEWCRAHGIEPFKRTVVYNHHLLLKACVNLLERRGLLSKKIFKEIVTGRRYKGSQETKDIIDLLAEAQRESGTL